MARSQGCVQPHREQAEVSQVLGGMLEEDILADEVEFEEEDVDAVVVNKENDSEEEKGPRVE